MIHVSIIARALSTNVYPYLASFAAADITICTFLLPLYTYNCKQMALQLAYYNMTGKHRATYEPAQMRKFLHGRTACVRGVSTPAVQWVQAMTTGPRQASQQKLALLKAAAAAHVRCASDAAAGHDVDRLMFGMSLVAGTEQERAFFKDPSYALSKHWAISTSHLSHEQFDNWGWGEVVPDGVGVAYMIQRAAVVVNVAAVRDAQREWPARLCHFVYEALQEMRVLCETADTTTPPAKL
jgi:carnitine O-acetyltransferase